MIGVTSLTIAIGVLLYNVYSYKKNTSVLKSIYEKWTNVELLSLQIKNLENSQSELKEELENKLITIKELQMRILDLQEEIKVQNEFVFID